MSTPPSLAEKSNNPYLIALVAGSAANGKQAAGIKKLLEKLANLQAVDGHLDCREGSSVVGWDASNVGSLQLRVVEGPRPFQPRAGFLFVTDSMSPLRSLLPARRLKGQTSPTRCHRCRRSFVMDDHHVAVR